MPQDIIFSRQKHIGIIHLNRPSALNALTLSMTIALQNQLIKWQHDDMIHAVVIKAEGKVFCAGGDVRELYAAKQANKSQQQEFFRHEYRLNHYIHHFSKPYIALMDGITMGGGVGVSVHGSFPVASESFIFAMPETTIGFFPDIGASYLLSRCPNALGIYLGLTSARLGLADSHALQLVKYFIPAQKMLAALESLVNEDLSVQAFARVNACLQQHAMPTPPTLLLQQQEMINACFNFSEVESIFHALAKKEDVWHRETLENLRKKSPLSLKVTLAQMQRAKQMSFADCLKMDFCLANHFLQGADFYEGVRALLIDKDKTPRWQLPTLSEVTNAHVASYFQGESLCLETI